MRFPTSILLSLIAIGVVTSSPTGGDDTIPNPRDLKSFLDWSNDLHRIDPVDKILYAASVAQLFSDTDIIGFGYIGEHLLELISKSAQLRDLLVKEAASGESVAETIREDASDVICFVITMSNMLDDLKSHISEWEKVKEGGAPIEKVTDPEPLNWFKEHGFHEDNLKDATIEELKVVVEGILNEGNALDRLSKMFGASFFDQPTKELSNNLMAIFHSTCTVQVRKQLDYPIKEEEKVFRMSSLYDALDNLQHPGIRNAMLQLFSRSGIDYTSRPDAATQCEDEVVYSEDIGKLTAMMASLAEYVPNQMKRLEQFLRSSCGEDLASTSGDRLRAEVPSFESRKRTADQILEALAEDGEVTSFAGMLRKCVDIMTRERPGLNECRKNLRK